MIEGHVHVQYGDVAESELTRRLPLPYAYVELWVGGALAGTTVTDGDGRFAFDSGSDQAHIKVFLSSRHGADGQRIVTLRSPDVAAMATPDDIAVEGAGVRTNHLYAPANHTLVYRRTHDVTVDTTATLAATSLDHTFTGTTSNDLALCHADIAGDSALVYRLLMEYLDLLLPMQLEPSAASVLRPLSVYFPGTTAIGIYEGGIAPGTSCVPGNDSTFHRRMWLYAGEELRFPDVVRHEFSHHVIKCLYRVWESGSVPRFERGAHDGGLIPGDPSGAFGEALASFLGCVCQADSGHRWDWDGGAIRLDFEHLPSGVASLTLAQRETHETLIAKFLCDLYRAHGLYHIWRVLYEERPANIGELIEAYRGVVSSDAAKTSEFERIMRDNQLDRPAPHWWQ